MTRVAVYFENSTPLGYPLNRPEYFRSNSELAAEVAALGGDYLIVRGPDTYEGEGRFSQSWRFDGAGGVKEAGPVQVDVLYDKGFFQPEDFTKVVNPPALAWIGSDKWRSYELFQEFQPETLYAPTESEYLGAIETIDAHELIVKPLGGYEGREIKVGTKAKLLKFRPNFPCVLQAYMDTTMGVDGIADGIHDFRIILKNGAYVAAFIRGAGRGVKIANIVMGGKVTMVERDDIPAPFWDMAQAVDAKLADHGPRFYGVDMMQTPDGVKLIEITPQVALQENARHPQFLRLKKALAALFMEVAAS